MNTHIKILAILFTFLLISAGCNDELDINENPDSKKPTSLALKNELPAAIASIIAGQGVNMALIGGFWSQYWTQSNSSNQYNTIEDYAIASNAGTIDNIWRNMYDALGDLRNIKALANENNNPKYYFIATVLEAYTAQILVDFFDKIPFTEATNPLILNPNYDDGDKVYELLLKNINEALSNDLISALDEEPAEDDVLFEGDMRNWIAFANTLKLKLYLRQSNVNTTIASAGIISLLNTDNFLTVDASFSGFKNEADKSNPLFEANERALNTATNLRASTTLHSFLSSNNDPRLATYYEAGNPLNQGDYNSTAGGIAVVNLSAETPVYLMSLEESLFMQAEAQLKFGSQTLAKTLYDDAVKESLRKNDVTEPADRDAFVATGGKYEYPTTGADAEKLEAIMMQKWVAGFPGNGFEGFFDLNRTGIPKTSTLPQSDENYIPGTLSYPINGITAGLFPKRLPAPSTSTSRNENAPAVVEITEPVWWNK